MTNIGQKMKLKGNSGKKKRQLFIKMNTKSYLPKFMQLNSEGNV